MRTLCLCLILLNALYFAWAQLIDSNPSNMDLSRSDVVRPPPIVLASEAEVNAPRPLAPARQENPPKPRSTASTSALVPPLPPAKIAAVNPCTSVGPFAGLKDASQAQAALRAVGFTPKQRFEQGGEMWVGYWVSVQNLETQKKAESAVKMLKDKGVTDVYLVPGSDPPNTLSLGVFSDYQRAQKRAEQISALGLEPKIEDRKRASPVFWIDVDILQPGQSIDTSIFQTEQGKIMRLELRDCPQTQAAVKPTSRAG
jgi:hypothetical protein